MARLRVRQKENVPVIELVDLVKHFGNKTVLKNLNLTISQGEFVTILGASGSGKTTALRLIGGFEWPTRGEIKFYGVDVKDLPAHKRPTNTIFQDYALFPHLTVEGNIKYGLKLVRVEKEKIDECIYEKLKSKKKKWDTLAKSKMEQLDKDQSEYEKNINNEKYKVRKKARRWLDNSDFHYSYWETYVAQKVENFRRKHITRMMKKDEIKKQVKKMIDLVGLEGNSKKSIDQLSGGMKQRVALARALVTRPQILLLDEPLSALDLKVRQRMQRELKNIQRELGLTFIFVTHDQEEAMTISDKIVVMRDGKVEQVGKPKEIYENPINSWVASFIGESNIFDATVVSRNKIKAFNKVLPGEVGNYNKNDKIIAMIRPEDISISNRTKGFISGKISTRTYQGTFWEYLIKSSKNNWKVRTTREFSSGDNVSLRWVANDIHAMEE